MRAPARPMATWRPPSAVWPASYRKVPARAAEKVYGWLAPGAVPTSAACADRPAENSPAGCPGNTRETGSASWLYNQLAEPVSLVFPGQPAGEFSAGLSAQAAEVGTAPGASQPYTFSAARAGTFLYEAGHTADAGRQVAMGLACA